MIATFERTGITFQYPQNWSLDDEAEGNDWVATIQTPGSALMVITYREDAEPAELGDETVDALREEYPELDAEVTVEPLAGQTAIGYDLDFITLDTPVTAKVRALESENGALLIFWQVAEKDREHYESLLDAVMSSVRVT
jgi:hypothetical protein